MQVGAVPISPTPRHFQPVTFSHEAHSGRELESLSAQAEMPVRFQPFGVDLPRLRINGVSKGRINFWHTRAEAGFLTISKAPLDIISLRVLRRGRMLRRNVQLDYEIGVGYGLLLPFEAMREMRSLGELDSISCSFSRSTLEQLREEIDEKPLAPLVFEPVVEMRTPALRLFVRTLERAFEMISTGRGKDDLTFPLLEEFILGQLLTVWPRRPVAASPVFPSPARRQISLALDFIDANLAQPIYVTDIARAIGINVRSLQKGFREQMGRTMVQHIIMRRLERAREDLVVADGRQVSEVAYRWGFTNLSEFSRRYQAQFGEAPSKTSRPGSMWSRTTR